MRFLARELVQDRDGAPWRTELGGERWRYRCMEAQRLSRACEWSTSFPCHWGALKHMEYTREKSDVPFW